MDLTFMFENSDIMSLPNAEFDASSSWVWITHAEWIGDSLGAVDWSGFYLAFGLYCNLSVKGIFRLSGKIPKIFKDCWNMTFSVISWDENT